MRLALFQFRRFSSRILALLLGLLFAVLATTYALVWRASETNAKAHAAQNLEIAAGIFEDTVRQRIEFLAGSASVMAGDYAIKQLFVQADAADADTLGTVLENYTRRVHSPVIVLLANNPERTLLANSDATMAAENLGPFRQLSRDAEQKDTPVESGFAYLGNELSVLVAVPLHAPFPIVASWFGLTFPIDHAFAENLKSATRIEVTFVSTRDAARPQALATTLPPAAAQQIARAATANLNRIEPTMLELPDDSYVTLFKRQPLLGENQITIVLQRPLGPELAAARELQKYLLLVSLAAFALATLCAGWIARGVSRPVLDLAAHTRRVAAGDYLTPVKLQRADELGQLATAFNAMSAGLAERDRVRDLLDKNVSPEVAAQLMRDGAALGGEEREVTILFADLRGFTTLSEQLAPRDLLTLLNRYLDRMSAEIEREGGVIDKFIGDAIMALFGAPVARSDSADRAIAAGLAMERALVGLNRELAAEGRPPLAIGIGINTARVVAGNIGSHRRLNYSVIGDGVNVASRLQSLTRTPEYRTNLITSAATLAAAREKKFATRALGAVAVKGRVEPVEIFSVE